MKKKFAVALMAALAMTTSACGLDGTEINEIGLIYSGGAWEDKEFQGVLYSGATAESVGMGSTTYKYPTDQRTWVTGQDAPAIEVVTEDGVRMKVPFQLYFKLNVEEETLVSFHENIGIKKKAYTPEGWTDMLNTYFAPQIDRAMDTAALKFKWRDLYQKEEARLAFQESVIPEIKTRINEVVGGDYFCGPSYNPGGKCDEFTFTIGKPDPTDPALVKDIESEQRADTQLNAQVAENRRIDKELEALKKQVALFGPEVYAWLQAIEAAREAGVAPPPFLPSGSSASIIVDGGSSPAARAEGSTR